VGRSSSKPIPRFAHADTSRSSCVLIASTSRASDRFDESAFAATLLVLKATTRSSLPASRTTISASESGPQDMKKSRCLPETASCQRSRPDSLTGADEALRLNASTW
jgi:hypothetical protein